MLSQVAQQADEGVHQGDGGLCQFPLQTSCFLHLSLMGYPSLLKHRMLESSQRRCNKLIMLCVPVFQRFTQGPFEKHP